ncbi:hypothetical protein [Mycolicibacterium sediminis]|uniref:Uncharacterized protein n=1 Tax=Mycolicibacterium sediminis TaxID=1286180 RepID=A0A7I7QWY8_9MYCO|nr:hypothetical protein [Mycolicibacterium sediminis]BBY30893.1 hypothetical protein MSEDJ_49890 [Mycolicibacterium sediminis]
MYDTRPFIDPQPRVPGFHDVGCHVEWLPRARGARRRSAVGDYLDADSADGRITLGCGIEQAATDLDVAFPAHVLRMCDAVDEQLAQHPWAELTCREGVLRIVLRSR